MFLSFVAFCLFACFWLYHLYDNRQINITAERILTGVPQNKWLQFDIFNDLEINGRRGRYALVQLYEQGKVQIRLDEYAATEAGFGCELTFEEYKKAMIADERDSDRVSFLIPASAT